MTLQGYHGRCPSNRRVKYVEVFSGRSVFELGFLAVFAEKRHGGVRSDLPDLK